METRLIASWTAATAGQYTLSTHPLSSLYWTKLEMANLVFTYFDLKHIKVLKKLSKVTKYGSAKINLYLYNIKKWATVRVKPNEPQPFLEPGLTPSID